jgi:hypothetical protein
MSDIDDHEFNEDHVRPVPLEDIPRHTWEVTFQGDMKPITAHMALRPTESLAAWHFVDFIENDDGDRTEHYVNILDANHVSSVVLVRPDGSRKEMVG